MNASEGELSFLEQMMCSHAVSEANAGTAAPNWRVRAVLLVLSRFASKYAE